MRRQINLSSVFLLTAVRFFLLSSRGAAEPCPTESLPPTPIMGGITSRFFSRGGTAKGGGTLEQSSQSAPPDGPIQKTVLGAGCYWGTEKFFRRHKFAHGTILDVSVGFMGGAKPNPSYREVCTGATGHVEVAEITFKGDTMMFAEMLKFFFSFHDPTTKDRQGNDRGDQYASTIFVYDDNQRRVATKVIDDLQTAMASKGHRFLRDTVVTAVRDATTFYPAHADHQRYLEKNPGGYCNHKMYISAWPGKTEADLSDDLKLEQSAPTS